MVELLQLLEAGLMVTAVTISAVAIPVTVVNDGDVPDLQPLIEIVKEK